LIEMVEGTRGRSFQDKALHSFSAVLKGGKRGLSFLAFNANGDKLEVFRQATAFAMMKKYDARCDEWIALGCDIAGSRSVDVAFFVSEPWVHDGQIEQLAKETLRPGKRIA